MADSAGATNRLIEVQAQFNAYQMLQQRRPKVKFSGDATKMDFEAHMRKFEVMTDVPGATDVMKLDELGHWFMGKADLVVGQFAASRDATRGLTEAKKALQEEFGRRRFTAKQLLDDLIVGDKYHEKEHGAIQTFLLQLEKVYHLAIETNWAATFNTREIYEEILRIKLPHLMNRWICRQEGAEVVGGEAAVNRDDLTFVQFIRFLKTHNHVSEGVANALQVKGATSTKSQASRGQAVVAMSAEEVPVSEGDSNGKGVGGRGARGPRRHPNL